MNIGPNVNFWSAKAEGTSPAFIKSDTLRHVASRSGTRRYRGEHREVRQIGDASAVAMGYKFDRLAGTAFTIDNSIQFRSSRSNGVYKDKFPFAEARANGRNHDEIAAYPSRHVPLTSGNFFPRFYWPQ
jgi:hypothetical protein